MSLANLVSATARLLPVAWKKRLARFGPIGRIRAHLYDRAGEAVYWIPSIDAEMMLHFGAHRVYLRQPFIEHHVVEFMRSRVAPGHTVVDIGAFIGFYSVLLGRLVGPRGHLVSVEPSPDARRLLVANLELNDLMARAEVVSAALADRPGELAFHVRTEAHGTAADARSSLSRVPSQGRALHVEGTTLDALVKRLGLQRLDLVKVDVEGAELRVLQGSVDTLTRLRPRVVIEVNQLDDLVAAVEFLASHGYRVELLGQATERCTHLAAWPKRPS